MGKAETLQRIRGAEAQVRAMRAQAEQEADRMLRDARREALEVQEQGRREAEARHDAMLKAAESDIAAKRRAVLDAGAREAATLKARGSANVAAATNAVLAQFKGAVDA